MTLTSVLGVDLGTSNSLVYVRGRGIVLDEPSLLALDAASGEVLAAGADAARLRVPPQDVRWVQPLRDGVVVDRSAAAALLRRFLRAARRYRWPRPDVLVCAPADVTDDERCSVTDAALAAGARAVYVIEEPIAAAIGAGVPIEDDRASMVLDVGGGTTEAAVLARGGFVSRASVRVGGDDLDTAVASHLEQERGLVVDQRTAEEVKIAVGSAIALPNEPAAAVTGRDARTGEVATRVVTAAEVRGAMHSPLQRIVSAVRRAYLETSPDLVRDVDRRGVVLCGGGALLPGLPELIQRETGLPAATAAAPLQAVALGTGRCLEQLDVLRRTVPQGT